MTEINLLRVKEDTIVIRVNKEKTFFIVPFQCGKNINDKQLSEILKLIEKGINDVDKYES